MENNEKLEESIYNDLPEMLKSLTEPFTDREKDIVLLSCIGVLSSCLPKVSGKYGRDEVYANIYFLLLAPAASGKGAMMYSRILIEKIHDKIKNESLERIEKFKQAQKNKKNKEFLDIPPLEVKILPANTSSTGMLLLMDSSKHGVLILESEADTMGNMLKNDWSSYSDILRKTFQHEPVSLTRKSDSLFVETNEPKLSIVMSGTPEQVKPLIKTKENGLFSRFLIYSFNEVSEFKNVFQQDSINFKSSFEEASNLVFDLYNRLIAREEKVEFRFTEAQQNELTSEFQNIHEIIVEHHDNGFISNLKRHGLILFRMAMVFTVIRNINNLNSPLVCSDTDFKLCLNITKNLLKHGLSVFYSFDENFLPKQDEDLLACLKDTFQRKDIIKVGTEKFEIPIRTIDDKLKQWIKQKVIKKISHGKYSKAF
nr:DUF3987 domain-containing protein [uncultured Psychroserpens sp.]